MVSRSVKEAYEKGLADGGNVDNLAKNKICDFPSDYVFNPLKEPTPEERKRYEDIYYDRHEPQPQPSKDIVPTEKEIDANLLKGEKNQGNT